MSWTLAYSSFPPSFGSHINQHIRILTDPYLRYTTSCMVDKSIAKNGNGSFAPATETFFLPLGSYSL